MIELTYDRKNLQFGEFSGRKPPSRRQGPDQCLFFWAALTSSDKSVSVSIVFNLE